MGLLIGYKFTKSSPFRPVAEFFPTVEKIDFPNLNWLFNCCAEANPIIIIFHNSRVKKIEWLFLIFS